MQLVGETDMKSPIVREVITWYNEAKAKLGRTPRKSEFRPYFFSSSVIPRLFMVHVERVPFRVLFRAAGEHVEESFGVPLTGKYLDQLMIPQRSDLTKWYQSLIDSTDPTFSRSMFTLDGKAVPYEGALFPLSGPAVDLRYFFGLEHFPEVASWKTIVRTRKYGEPASKNNHLDQARGGALT